MRRHTFRIADVLALSFIVAVAIVLHVYFWKNTSSAIRGNYLAYFQTLSDHFWAYFDYTALKPPMTYLIHGALVHLFGLDAIRDDFIVQKFVILFDIIGLMALYASLRILRLGPIFAAALAIGFGIYIMPFEFWRQGVHYDHLSIFFNLVFILGVTIFVRKPSLSSGLFMSVAGALTLAHNTVFSMIVPIVILASVYFATMRRRSLVSAVGLAAMLLVMPVGMALTISYKNYAVSGTFAPSTLGGVALMLVSMNSVGHDTEKLRPLLDEAGAPDWYKWCYDNAVWDPEAGPMAAVNSRSFGHCGISPDFGEAGWPLEMSGIEAEMRLLGAKGPLAAAEHDQDIIDHRPYLLYGFAPELSLHWVDIYGRVSSNLFVYDLFHDPVRYIETFQRQERVFNRNGPQFPVTLIDSPGSALNLNKSGSAVVKTIIARSATALRATALPLLAATLIGAIFCAGHLGALLLGKKPPVIDPVYATHLVFGGTVLILTVLFSTIVGAENDRYFMYAAPYSIVSIAAIAAWAFHFVRKRTAKTND